MQARRITLLYGSGVRLRPGMDLGMAGGLWVLWVPPLRWLLSKEESKPPSDPAEQGALVLGQAEASTARLQSRLKSCWMLSPEEPWGQADSREVGDPGGVCTSELGTPKLSVPWTHHWLWEPGTRSIGAPEFWLLAGWLVPAETCLVSVFSASPQNTTFLPSWAFCDRNLSMGCSLASPSSEQLCMEKECWTLDVERNMQELSVQLTCNKIIINGYIVALHFCDIF